MIRHVRELTRRRCDAVVVGNIYFQERRLTPLLCDLLRRFATSLCIPRTHEYVKSFRRELSRHFAPDAFVRSGNQHCFHVLFIELVGILRLQEVLEQRLRVRRQFFYVAQFLCDRARANIDVFHLARCLLNLLLYRR